MHSSWKSRSLGFGQIILRGVLGVVRKPRGGGGPFRVLLLLTIFVLISGNLLRRAAQLVELAEPVHGRCRGSRHHGRHQVEELRADSPERSTDGCDPDDPRPRGLRQKVQSHDHEKH